MPKVCFFNSCKTWGGGEKWHYDAATYLHQQGFDVTVAADVDGPLLKKSQQMGLKTNSVKVGNLSALNPAKVLSLARWMRNEKYNTIILNLPSDLKFAGIAAKIANVGRVIYRRGSAIPISNTFLNRWIFHNLLSDVIANSIETRNTILKNNLSLFPKEHIHVIYNGIDFDSNYDTNGSETRNKNNERSFIIGNVARLSRQKNQKALVDPAVLLKRRGRNFKVLIAGDGPLKKELISYTHQCGVDNEIEFIGFAEDVGRFMSGIDLFILPSLWEGFGYVLVEAMAAEKPVIAFDVSSNPEIISDGETGFLVPFADLKALADKTCLFMDNSELREEMGRNGYLRARNEFDKSNNLKVLANMLSEGG